MAAWKKSPQSLIDTFAAALPDDPRLERRAMFGYPCTFVGGNMCTGLHQEDMIVRLDEEEREKLVRGGARIFEPMKGRPMKEDVVVPAAILADGKKLRALVTRSLAYALSLPPKAKAK